ncbi:unnamed protein product [Moneuplotes crassus]|uniref:Uncharacterized protein n=1 Tax=Euplotes crassus TaxID=5936 RepID=A0AAD1U0K9_EUPCR|nr:unnamed protein product [Moneuplotes crassus]
MSKYLPKLHTRLQKKSFLKPNIERSTKINHSNPNLTNSQDQLSNTNYNQEHSIYRSTHFLPRTSKSLLFRPILRPEQPIANQHKLRKSFDQCKSFQETWRIRPIPMKNTRNKSSFGPKNNISDMCREAEKSLQRPPAILQNTQKHDGNKIKIIKKKVKFSFANSKMKNSKRQKLFPDSSFYNTKRRGKKWKFNAHKVLDSDIPVSSENFLCKLLNRKVNF